MRILFVPIAIMMLLGSPAVATAQSDSAAQVDESPANAPGSAPAQEPDSWGDKSDDGHHKGKPVAKGSPYNVKQIIFGSFVMLLMGIFLLWLIRRNTRDRSE